MSSAALKLVEGHSMDKAKALDAALSQIERAFGIPPSAWLEPRPERAA
jgi:hypothetical protein